MSNFFGNAVRWVADHVEGEKRGDATAAQIEASPIIAKALQAGEQALETVLITHVGAALKVEPTSQGVTAFLGGLIDRAAEIPPAAKEPLKLYLGGRIVGSNFFAQAAQSPDEKASVEVKNDPAPEKAQGGPAQAIPEAAATPGQAGTQAEDAAARAMFGAATVRADASKGGLPA